MEAALLDDRNFVAEKQNVVILSTTAIKVQQDHDIEKQRQLRWNVLTVPKRFAFSCSL